MFSSSMTEFGSFDDKPVFKYILSNGSLTATFLNYGATLISFKAPDRMGVIEEITMNRSTLDDITHRSDYFGSTIGRNAFRIKHGCFQLDDTLYSLKKNSGNNHNHGGVKGFDKCLWDADIKEESDRISVIFTRVSSDMEEGYPGELHVTVTYSLTNRNELDMTFEAEGNEKPTIVNMTNHAYWNLSGECKRKVDHHMLLINSDSYLDGEDMIPNETPIPVVGTLMDFTSLHSLTPSINEMNGGGMPGIDHAFCLRGFSKEKILRPVAKLIDPESGRCIDISTTECALIVYTSNWLNEKPPFTPHYAICLEPGYYPDTPNHPSFPSSTVLPGEKYYHHTVFSFSTISFVL